MEPLVSVLITNYNNGKYLEYCYDSVLRQTYKNIEVISYDNQSDDNSYEIMLKYKEKFRQQGIWMDAGMNKRNVGSSGNTSCCFGRSEGQYVVFLSSDDAIKPTFIEKCVEVLSSNSNVGMVMVHRDEMDEQGILSKTEPFYNKSCIIPGESQASVFMMAGIAVPSQIMMKRYIVECIARKPIILQVAGDWIDNFISACNGDVAYLKEALCEYRNHALNDTTASEKNLVGIFEHYQLINAFMWIGESYGYKKHLKRYDEAIEKLGDMCLRYAHKMLRNREKKIAKRYLYLAPVFKESILDSELYASFVRCCSLEGEAFDTAFAALEKTFVAKRIISYDPPSDCIELKELDN